MAQPPKSPTSLRIPEATRVRVEKWATEQGIPRNAAYVELIERGMKAAGPHPGLNQRPHPGKTKAGRMAVAEYDDKFVRPAKAKLVREIEASAALHFPKAAPGSRLKVQKK